MQAYHSKQTHYTHQLPATSYQLPATSHYCNKSNASSLAAIMQDDPPSMGDWPIERETEKQHFSYSLFTISESTESQDSRTRSMDHQREPQRNSICKKDSPT